MKGKNKLLIIAFFVISIILIFRNWFGMGEISAGDSGFYWQKNISNFSWLPVMWNYSGLGSFISWQYSYIYLYLPIKILFYFSLKWVIIERIIWFFPFIILTIYSSYYFFKKFNFIDKYAWLGIFVYSFNTYILMIVGGGQVSIFLAYAVFPLVLVRFLISYKSPLVKNLIILGLCVSLLASFEPRYSGMCLLISIFISIVASGLKITNLIKNILAILIIFISLNFYWILPAVIFPRAVYDASLNGKGWVDFLSNANFSNSLSFLHPLWPENIFGKTYLMRPEFLLLPIIVFLPLIFINIKKFKNIFSPEQRKVYFFGLLLIITGAFVSKGTNPPFGNIYRYFYTLPFFNTFRDPVKFYFITAVGYMITIPLFFTYYQKIIDRYWPRRKFIFNFLLIFFLAYWIFLLRPAFLGKLSGTFKAKSISIEYYQLENFFSNQNQFFRTLWIPNRQRFGYLSDIHPAINSDEFISPGICQKPFCNLQKELDSNWTDICDLTNRCYVSDLGYFLNTETEDQLKQISVKYLIVPTDPQGEIFINERSYSDSQRERLIDFLDTISWLKPVKQFSDLKIYELDNPKDLFFTDDINVKIDWKLITPTKYEINLTSNKINKIYFSQTFDPAWQLLINGKIYPSLQNGQIMSFEVNQTGNFIASLEFIPQRYVLPGTIISILALLSCFGYLVYERKNQRVINR